MSRRASLFSKENPGKSRPRVRFPDELVFLDNVKENDAQAVNTMLRRASVQIDINGIGDSGMTPLHQACIEGNLTVVRLLVGHGADVCRRDADTWTPLHAACAEGYVDVARLLLDRGADPTARTEDGERPVDLVESDDFPMIALMLSYTSTEEEDEGLGEGGVGGEESDRVSEDSDEDDIDEEEGRKRLSNHRISTSSTPIGENKHHISDTQNNKISDLNIENRITKSVVP